MTTRPIHLRSLDEGQVALADDNDDVRGLVVLDANGHRIGEVDDIVVDEEQRRARLLVVASGGVLGLGAHRHLVPVEAVARVTDHVRLQHSAEVVPPAEDYDGRADPAECAASYSHYGLAPFWDPAHAAASSSFHDRRS